MLGRARPGLIKDSNTRDEPTHSCLCSGGGGSQKSKSYSDTFWRSCPTLPVSLPGVLRAGLTEERALYHLQEI